MKRRCDSSRVELAQYFAVACVCLIALGMPSTVAAQESADDSLTVNSLSDSSLVAPGPERSTSGQDTVIFRPGAGQLLAGSVADTTDYEKHKYQNPTVALFKSMVVPGWGQFDNHSYFKALVFAGLQTWFVINALKYGSRASDARELWEQSTDPVQRNLLYVDFDEERDQRNRYRWYIGITAFIAMFDAYVDAHLSGSPDRARRNSLRFDVGPDARGGAQATVRLRF